MPEPIWPAPRTPRVDILCAIDMLEAIATTPSRTGRRMGEIT